MTWGDVTGSVLWALAMSALVVALIAVLYAVYARRQRTFSGSEPAPVARARAELDHLYAIGQLDRAEYDRRVRALERSRREGR